MGLFFGFGKPFTLSDTSGNGYDLTNNNGLVSGDGYNSSCSISDDGSSWAQIPNAVLDTAADWDGGSFEGTLSCWFKTSTAGGGIMGCTTGLPTANPSGYVPALYVGSDHKLHGSFIWHGAVGVMTSTTSIDDNNWHLGVITYSTTDTKTERLYIDSGTDTQSRSSQNETSFGPYYYTIGATFGSSWPSHPASWSYFNGLIDDVRIYNRAITSTEVSNMYSGSPPATGLIAHWPFEA